jgi:hypothetical protein
LEEEVIEENEEVDEEEEVVELEEEVIEEDEEVVEKEEEVIETKSGFAYFKKKMERGKQNKKTVKYITFTSLKFTRHKQSLVPKRCEHGRRSRWLLSNFSNPFSEF